RASRARRALARVSARPPALASLRGSRRDRGALLRDGAAAGRGGAPRAAAGVGSGRGRAPGETVVDTMVALHAVDFARAGLGALGRPEGFMARQVRGWAERWERARDR